MTAAPDRVERLVTPAVVGAPDRRWVAAITDVATRAGWLCLAVVLAAFSRQVVGWAMADQRRSEVVLTAVEMAIRRRRPAAGRIHHADHGCQSTARAFGQRLPAAGSRPARGSVGDGDDHAVAERVLTTIHGALLHRQVWPTRAAARLAIVESSAVWSHRQRRHSTLGSVSPADYEARDTEVAIT